MLFVCSPELLFSLQVRAHEPHLALDGGSGPGTDALDAVCSAAANLLRPGGFLALETAGGEQAHAVAAMLRLYHADGGSPAAEESEETACSTDGRLRHGNGSEDELPASDGALAFRDVEVIRDCFGVERFVKAWRTGVAL